MGNKWKTLAIVLIIILVVENLLFFWILSLGLDEMEREDKCGEVICIDDDAFYYDSIDNICYCFVDNEIVYEEVME